jgi:hypothetical protein
MSFPTIRLPHSNAGRCTVCKCWLYYQRVDTRIGIREHYFFCGQCGRKYAAWETWTPGASAPNTSGSS